MPDKAFIEGNFVLPGPISTVSLIGSGHIHDTYLVNCSNQARSSFILQKFNHLVFQHPGQVMSNIAKVLGCLDKSSGLQKISIVRTRENHLMLPTMQGDYWRMFTYLAGSEAIDQVQNLEQAKAAAGAFGEFLNVLTELNPDELFVTIPDFHNLPKRFENFKDVLRNVDTKRRSLSKNQVDIVLNRAVRVEHLARFLHHPDVPMRITHNDTKINNALFKKGTNQSMAVIDLDTVMPGLLLYDFGDMARTFCNNAFEQDTREQAVFRTDYFEWLCIGFFNSFQPHLKSEEIESLKAGPWWMTFIMGIRFLTDYLEGDVYYKTSYPQQNLARAENQLGLLLDIENKQGFIDQTIEQYVSRDYS